MDTQNLQAQEIDTTSVDPLRFLTGEVVLTDDPEARAMAAYLGGDIRSAPAAFGRVALSFRDQGALHRVAAPSSTRSQALVFLGRSDHAMREGREAVELAQTLGQDDVVAYALWHRSEAQTSLGRVDDALTSAEEVLAIADRLDHRGWLAPAWRAIGLAHEAANSVRAALGAQQRSLEAGRDVPLFASWAHARIALLQVRSGDLDAAVPSVMRALRTGPPLAQYEARLASCTLSVYRHDAAADRLVADARRRAVDGGHRASSRLLAAL